MLYELINQLKSDFGVSEGKASPGKKRFLLPFENDIQIEAIQTENSYLLKGIIGECPKRNPDPFLLYVMEGNLFGIGTRKASIGLTEKGNLLTLSLELDYNCSYNEFKERLIDFISVIEFWRNESLNPR